VTPYGVYDIAANTGFVNVGTDHDTAAFAIESIRCWWNTLGRDRYPGVRQLLITADAGGSNSYRTRAWKTGLADLAAETGLEITCCHFPPGTSKWNQIEHRLFSQISRNWRARPLTSHEVIIKTIAATTTAAGLAVTAQLDTRDYPVGATITRAQVRELEDTGALTRHGFHGNWNYTLRPATAGTPPPAPARDTPGPAGGPILDALAHPALTGLSRPDFAALATTLAIPFAAAREQRLHLARGAPRRKNSGPAGSARLGLDAQLLAAIYRYRLGMTCQHIATLLAIDPSAISIATRHIACLLSRDGTVLTPGPHRLRSTGDLQRYATSAGITLPDSPAQAHPAPNSTLRTHDTPQTQLISRHARIAADNP
jgi:hypothetical protein